MNTLKLHADMVIAVNAYYNAVGNSETVTKVQEALVAIAEEHMVEYDMEAIISDIVDTDQQYDVLRFFIETATVDQLDTVIRMCHTAD